MFEPVAASLIPFAEPPMEVVDGRWYGPRGAFMSSDPKPSGTCWILCCPACGQMGSPRNGQTWQVVSGSWDDVTTLTLSPSILKDCCGWHGYLKDGKFVL